VAVLEVPLDRGGSGVAVVADGYWPAKQARDLLVIEWDTGAVDKVDSGKQMAQFAALARTPGAVARKAGTARLADAHRKIAAVYEFPYLAHAPMEPINCTVDLKIDACTLWVG